MFLIQEVLFADVYRNKLKKNKLSLTNKNMTRFNISLEEGVNFVIMALKNMIAGKLLSPLWKLSKYRFSKNI